MSFHATRPSGKPQVWCKECRSLRKSSHVVRPTRREAEETPELYIASRLATYSSATRLALCHLQRNEPEQAAQVLIAAQYAS